ncbi:CaiB/BaiF CoA transferase family protein [Kaistia terrae]|uniref:CaiB/BaiF CoA transferase family protein n=1 Tax=Kaistia terrae TaxID=537017 RepID=A0ABW0PZR5_9HYPH|nr:CaiB/BaiF CoA-transferase family protein [Kaistia terrae]MCX5580885.1 CaiB/BaiF CoA-transferase family protein [Kaistia terrae]
MAGQTEAARPIGALSGIRVLDMSRILAGPTCTQILGDLGAEIIKLEKPGAGDDTRKWGPPYIEGPDGQETTESAYYLSANRNKRSLGLDFTKPEGHAILLRLLESCDVLVENFKTGTLKRYGLDHDSLKTRFPGLVYCSITGFGQTGPYAARAGYDYIAQAMGGIMSVTGSPDGPPMKVGVGIADVTTGLYATIGIIAALRHRDATGKGQHLDIALLDTQVSWLVNEATNYLVSGVRPVRRGNEHPNIVPYKAYETLDGFIVLAVGNDAQFRRWCDLADLGHLGEDPRFSSNANRVVNRVELDRHVAIAMKLRTTANWLAVLETEGVPAGPVNGIDEVFSDPQVLARGMRIEMPYPHDASGTVALVGSPLKLSETPVSYRYAPPLAGEHSKTLLSQLAGLADDEIVDLVAKGVVSSTVP